MDVKLHWLRLLKENLVMIPYGEKLMSVLWRGEKTRKFSEGQGQCTAGWYYCGNWWLPTLILITRITVQRSVQSIRETRLWTICGWSPVPTNSWLEVGRRGNKFRGNYSSITNCCTAFAGRQLKVKSSCCSFFLRSYVSFYSEYCFNVISTFNWFK